MSKYKVEIRGKLPEGIAEKISALHAEVLKNVKKAPLSNRKASSPKTGREYDVPKP